MCVGSMVAEGDAEGEAVEMIAGTMVGIGVVKGVEVGAGVDVNSGKATGNWLGNPRLMRAVSVFLVLGRLIK